MRYINTIATGAGETGIYGSYGQEDESVVTDNAGRKAKTGAL